MRNFDDFELNEVLSFESRVAGTMVARSPSVRGITRSNPSQVPCGEVTSCTAGCQEVGMCSNRSESRGMYNIRLRQVRIRQDQLWLSNPEETSLEIQNRGASGPTKGQLSAKNIKNRSVKFYPLPLRYNIVFAKTSLGNPRVFQ